MANETLMDAYEKVFDAHGQILPCGRDACIALIEECKKASPKIYFGNIQTGEMEVKSIKWLVRHKRKFRWWQQWGK